MPLMTNMNEMKGSYMRQAKNPKSLLFYNLWMKSEGGLDQYEQAVIYGPSEGNDPLEEDLKKPFFVWENYNRFKNDWNYNRYPKWNHPDATGGPPDPNYPGVKFMLLKANWPKKASASFETLEEAMGFAELLNEITN